MIGGLGGALPPGAAGEKREVCRCQSSRVERINKLLGAR